LAFDSQFETVGEYDAEVVQHASTVVTAVTEGLVGVKRMVIPLSTGLVGTHAPRPGAYGMPTALVVRATLGLPMEFGYRATLHTAGGRLARIELRPHAWNTRGGQPVDYVPDRRGLTTALLFPDIVGVVRDGAAAWVRAHARLTASIGYSAADLEDARLLDDPIGSGYLSIADDGAVSSDDPTLAAEDPGAANVSRGARLAQTLLIHCGPARMRAPDVCRLDELLPLPNFTNGAVIAEVINKAYDLRCCWNCGIPGGKLCSKCQIAAYCSDDKPCQAIDWKAGHSSECRGK